MEQKDYTIENCETQRIAPKNFTTSNQLIGKTWKGF